jgi:hypothetical protein
LDYILVAIDEVGGDFCCKEDILDLVSSVEADVAIRIDLPFAEEICHELGQVQI